jgi:hypothetical protein
MSIPTKLKHKPVIVCDDYENVDGRYAYDSDAKGLSVGLAQWNDRGKLDVSAKVWRYTGEKWSRQSEEMPLHRILDLAILVCRTKLYFQETSYRYPKLYDESNPKIDRIGVQGDAMTVNVCTENPMIDQDIALFAQALAKDDELLGERFHVLENLLRELNH